MSALTKEQIEMLPMMIEEIRAVLPSAGEKTKPFIEILDDLFGTVIEQQSIITQLSQDASNAAELALAGDAMAAALNNAIAAGIPRDIYQAATAALSQFRAALEVKP